MIISPARFEDMINQCLNSNMDERAKEERIGEILAKTLESMGYASGLKRIEEYLRR